MKHATLKITAFELVEDSNELLRSLIGRVAAGAPLEVIGDEELVDLNYIVSRGPYETMMVTLEGDSMYPDLADGDKVIIALGMPPELGHIVIARVDGGYTIKKFKHQDTRLYLVPSNGAHSTRALENGDRILGVVTYILKKAA